MEDTSMPLFTPIAPVRGRFKRKLTAAALLALTPVLALAGMLVLNHVVGCRSNAVARDAAEARHLGVALSSHLNGLLQQQTVMLDTVSTSWLQSGSPVRVMDSILSDLRSWRIIGCSLFSTDGQLLCTAGIAPNYTPPFDSSLLEPVLSGKKPTVCFVAAQREDGPECVLRVILANQVQRGESGLRVLATEVDVGWMAAVVERIWDDGSGPDVCGFVDPNGQVLLWNHSKPGHTIRKSLESLNAKWPLDRDEAATMIFTHRGGWDDEAASGTYGVSAVAIPSLGWASIAATRNDPASAVAGDHTLAHIWSIVITSLASLLVAFGLMRRVSAEACALERAAIAVGAGDLSARSGLGGTTDVGAAGRAFDEMAVSLAELEQSRLQALRVASHELRNPLSAVKGAASLLSMRMEEGKRPAELMPLVDIMVRQADDLTDKMTRVFDALILANHWRIMDKRPVELRELARETLRPFLAAESGNRIAVFGLDPDLPHLVVIGDREQLATVIASLVSNGLKYSMGQGMVRVAVRPIENVARITVSDHGIGVPDAELTSIFDGFARGSNLEGHDPGGLGLGLYVSAMIVRQHGGRIWVESDGQTGARFHVEFPLHPVVFSTRNQNRGDASGRNTRSGGRG
jgi:signal transduction histidine kinase